MWDEAVYRRAAGVDVAKDGAAVCVRVAPGGVGKAVCEEEQFGATMSQVRRLRAWLEERRVEAVMMESTATYWKPFYYGLAGAGFEVVLVNPYHVKALKGRKSDMSDAKWLSVQAALGVAPRSLVPGRDQVDLRLATRQRRKAVGRRTQLQNSLEKLLEDAQTKLSSAGSKLLTKSGRAFLESIAEGRDDPEELAKLSRLRKTKGAELVEMLEGEWRPIHRALIRDLLNGFDAEDRRVLSPGGADRGAGRPVRRRDRLVGGDRRDRADHRRRDRRGDGRGHVGVRDGREAGRLGRGRAGLEPVRPEVQGGQVPQGQQVPQGGPGRRGPRGGC